MVSIRLVVVFTNSLRPLRGLAVSSLWATIDSIFRYAICYAYHADELNCLLTLPVPLWPSAAPDGSPPFRQVFSYMRLRSGSPGYAVVINTSDQTVTADLTKAGVKELGSEGTVAVRSSQATSEASAVGTRVQFKAVPLGPKEGMVLSFVPQPGK